MDNWYLLILLSAVSLGLYDFCKKHGVAKNRVMPVLFFATLCGTVFMCAATLALGCWNDYFFCSFRDWILIFIKAAIVASSWIAGYFALHDLPISIAAPIRASAPMWTLLGGVLLFGERPRVLQLLGIAAVFCGYCYFNGICRLEGFTWRSRGVRMVVAATLIGAGSALYDRFLMRVMELNPNVVQLHFSLDLVIVIGLAWMLQRRVPFMHEEQPFRWRWSIPVIGVMLIIADWLFFHAVSMPGTQIGILAVLRRCSVVVSFLCGACYFHERELKRKSLALVFILLGVIILGLCK